MREKYESLALVQLKELAKVRGLKGTSTMKKAELVEVMLAEDERLKKLEQESAEKNPSAATEAAPAQQSAEAPRNAAAGRPTTTRQPYQRRENVIRNDSSSKSSTTTKLMKMLQASPSQFMETHIPTIKDTTFQEYLYQLMEEKEKTIPDLIADACISKSYAYQFLNGERLPGRDIILRIGLSMSLSMDEIQRLLTLAGKSILYPKLHRDAGILYCIRKKMSVDEANYFLTDIGEVSLL